MKWKINRGKKSFYRVRWKEVAALLIVDFFILAVVVYWSFLNCVSAPNMIVINPDVICAAYFFLNFGNLIPVFAVAVIVNFILSGVWHFAVRK